MEELEKKIDKEVENNSPEYSEAFIQEVNLLEFNQELRDYVKEQLKKKEYKEFY